MRFVSVHALIVFGAFLSSTPAACLLEETGPLHQIRMDIRGQLAAQDAQTWFTIGSHKDDVLRLQGTPSSILRGGSMQIWSFGFSTVDISTQTGRVLSFSNISGNLKVSLRPGNK